MTLLITPVLPVFPNHLICLQKAEMHYKKQLIKIIMDDELINTKQIIKQTNLVNFITYFFFFF